MATGLVTDMKLYDPFVYSGFVETVVQNADAFNAASGGAIRLIANPKIGKFDYESFFKLSASTVRRRDPESNEAVEAIKLTMDELIGVKLKAGIGPVENAIDSLRTPGFDIDAFRVAFGRASGVDATLDHLHCALLAVTSAIYNQATNKLLPLDGNSATRKMETTDLVDALALMGDQASRIGVWVMHSKVYYDLVKDQIVQNIAGVSSFNIASATPITLNRPVLVTDDTALVVSGSPNKYRTLGLVQDAVRVEDTENLFVNTQIINGRENIVINMQGEYAFNLKVRGFRWDTQNGGTWPSNTAIGTGSNWDKVYASTKDLAGIVIETL